MAVYVIGFTDCSLNMRARSQTTIGRLRRSLYVGRMTEYLSLSIVLAPASWRLANVSKYRLALSLLDTLLKLKGETAATWTHPAHSVCSLLERASRERTHPSQLCLLKAR